MVGGADTGVNCGGCYALLLALAALVCAEAAEIIARPRLPSGYNTSIMSSTLLHTDEEADAGVYGAYLRAQDNADLLDIARHLDPDLYPARAHWAARELARRGLLETRVYSPAESVIRQMALGAFALALALVVLWAFLSPDAALGPSWPTGEMLPDGAPLSVVAGIFCVALLRGAVVWSVKLGAYWGLLLGLGGWSVWLLPRVLRRRARRDVWRLALLGFLALVLATALALAPGSAIPQLFAPPPGP